MEYNKLNTTMLTKNVKQERSPELIERDKRRVANQNLLHSLALEYMQWTGTFVRFRRKSVMYEKPEIAVAILEIDSYREEEAKKVAFRAETFGKIHDKKMELRRGNNNPRFLVIHISIAD